MKNFCRGLAFCFCPVGRLYETGLSAAEAGCRTLFFHVKRECGIIVPPRAALFILYGFYMAMHPGNSLFPPGVSRLGSDGGEADGRLKARAAGTVCLQTRAVARRRFQPFGRRHRNRSGGFCCFSPHVVFRGSARAAALHGARKIRPMRHPVADAPQPAPSFSASNESADLLCRQRRHYYTMRSGSPYQLTCPARLRLRVTFVSQNQPPSQLHFFFFRKAIPGLVPMAKKRTGG